MEKEQIIDEIKKKFPYNNSGFFCWSNNFEDLEGNYVIGPLIPLHEMRSGYLFLKISIRGCIFIYWNDITSAKYLGDIIFSDREYLSIIVKNFKLIPGTGPIWRKNS